MLRSLPTFLGALVLCCTAHTHSVSALALRRSHQASHWAKVGEAKAEPNSVKLMFMGADVRGESSVFIAFPEHCESDMMMTLRIFRRVCLKDTELETHIFFRAEEEGEAKQEDGDDTGRNELREGDLIRKGRQYFALARSANSVRLIFNDESCRSWSSAFIEFPEGRETMSLEVFRRRCLRGTDFADNEFYREAHWDSEEERGGKGDYFWSYQRDEISENDVIAKGGTYYVYDPNFIDFEDWLREKNFECGLLQVSEPRRVAVFSCGRMTRNVLKLDRKRMEGNQIEGEEITDAYAQLGFMGSMDRSWLESQLGRGHRVFYRPSVFGGKE